MIDTSLKTYGEDVFSEKAIRMYLSKPVAAKLLATMRESKPLDPSIALRRKNGRVVLLREFGYEDFKGRLGCR